MLGDMVLVMIVCSMGPGCLLTLRQYQRASRATILAAAARDRVLTRYATLRDGRRYDPRRNPELAQFD